MNRENVTLQLDTDTLEKINRFVELDKKSQNDFINELLDSALNNYFLMLTGGMVVTVPNPQFYHIDRAKALENLARITNVAAECTKANMPTGMYAIANYLKTRVFDDSSAQREAFKAALQTFKR